MTDVITGLGPEWESLVAMTLESASGLTVIRRCADVAELLSVAEAGLGECAVVSEDLRGLDLSVVRRLSQCGVLVVGLYPAGGEAAERRLRQLGITAVLAADADADAFGVAVRDGVARDTGGGGIAARWRGSGPSGQQGQDRPVDVPDHPPAEAFDGGPVPDDTDVAGAPHPLSADPRTTAAPSDDGWQPRGAEVSAGRGPGLDPDAGATHATVVAVWGPHGAPGRTTTAINVAAELASRGQQVLLVDADTYGGCVAQALGLLDEAPGIAAACRAADQGALDLPFLARLAPFAMPGLRVLTGLPKAERWPELRGAALERVLDLGRQLASVVVVDCAFCLEDDEELSYDTTAPRRNEATLTTLARADTVLAVGGADPVALQRFVRALQELGSVPSPPPVPVVNRVRSSAVGARPEDRIAESLRRFAGLDGLHFVPHDGAVVDAALLAGRSVVEHAPESSLRASYAALATEVAPWTGTRAGMGRRRRRRRFGAVG
ncbi:ParA family protein [Intrasporangium sp.]|uniref:AAA family ATPase n=1 Tax=Intrasporangium sp. TaxID=1925024 RepID=UPI00293AD53F|nr:ParA family protein [Intrasporangium sp.]MDV3220048.1 ParA family protein [Intrasporangium sp.]